MQLQDKTAFVKKIQDLVAEKNMLQHPFYRKWNDGKLTKTELQEYAKQYSHFMEHFPRFLSAIHSNCENKEVRRTLLANLADEEGFKTSTANHPELWENFATGLGLSHEEYKNVSLLPETKNLVNGFYQFAKSENYLAGIAAMYAYESQIPSIAVKKIEGLKAFYGIQEPKTLEFFEVHAEADVYHSKEELDILTENATTAESQQAVLEAVKTSTELLWKFLDGIYETYCQN
ncbi:MAG: CADD family putative folate metabolism protein [Microscillaceae bacterium]|nr:CADD family putative folate metabolism protein [Microscillaceae bacterium]MDW8460240.1 CADD family putative folate metabolism protein [Cytophagales bacterium]